MLGGRTVSALSAKFQLASDLSVTLRENLRLFGPFVLLVLSLKLPNHARLLLLKLFYPDFEESTIQDQANESPVNTML